MTGATQLGTSVIVVGREGPDCPTCRDQDATVWRLANGRWSQVCDKDSGCGGGKYGQLMWDVTRWHGKAVAVGYD